MRRIRRLAAQDYALGGLADCVAIRLPVVKAIPAELVRRANLIGEAERVDPTFLLCPPSAIPSELDQARLAAALDRYAPDEIGAARPCVDAESIDRPFRMSVQQLIDEADDLDPRNAADQRDGRRFRTGRERQDVSLEALRSARARKELGVYRHGRNISGKTSVLGALFPRMQTNLTGGSTLNAQRENRPW